MKSDPALKRHDPDDARTFPPVPGMSARFAESVS